MKNKKIVFSIILCLVATLIVGNISFAWGPTAGNQHSNAMMINGGGLWPGKTNNNSSSAQKPSSSNSQKPSSSTAKPIPTPAPSPSEPTPPPQPTYKTIYTNTRTKTFTATLIPEKSFYKLGDIIQLEGARDIENIISSQVLSTAAGSTAKSPTGTVGSYMQSGDVYRYYVDMTFEGFRVAFNGATLPKTINENNDVYGVFLDSFLNTDNWKAESLKIVEVKPTEYLDYDASKGVATGKITVHSGYGTSKTFIIPFQFAPEGYSVDVYSDNSYLGTVSDSFSGKFEGQEVIVSAFEKVEGAFQYWYKKNADGTTEIVSYNKNYTFTMPAKNLVLVAHFEYNVETYKLYDVTTRAEPEGAGEIVGVIPEKATLGQQFDVDVKINNGYVFEHWYYLDEDGNKVIVSTESSATVIMPGHPLELVAVFKEIEKYTLYVTSNNTLWGEAWTTPDDSDERVWERLAVEGKEYSINVLPHEGYEFVEFVYKPEIENPLEKDGKIKMPSHDITVTAIFKEIAPDITENPLLYISVNNPKWGEAYVVDKNGKKHYANTDLMALPNSFVAEADKSYAIFYEAKPGYKFVGWYTAPDIDLGLFAENLIMPSENLMLTAFFALDVDTYSLIVSASPEDAGQVEGSVEKAYFGRDYLVEASPSTDYKFKYWYYIDKDGEKVIVSDESKFYFRMLEQDVVLVAQFGKKSERNPNPIEPSNSILPEDIPNPVEDKTNTSLKVTSVRDLRWKDYFVDEYGNYLSANALKIPNAENVLMVNREDYPSVLKTGYAVEFEMKTIMVPNEYAKLIIKPEVYEGSKKVEFSKIVDKLSGEKLSETDKYSEIIILGTDLDASDSFETKAIADKANYNGVEYDEITWNWFYYLPSKLVDTNGNSFTKDLTIKLNIELYDSRKGKVLDYIVSLNKNDISNWNGAVFQYSATESLLDDIYNNAT